MAINFAYLIENWSKKYYDSDDAKSFVRHNIQNF